MFSKGIVMLVGALVVNAGPTAPNQVLNLIFGEGAVKDQVMGSSNAMEVVAFNLELFNIPLSFHTVLPLTAKCLDYLLSFFLQDGQKVAGHHGYDICSRIDGMANTQFSRNG